MTTAQEFTEAIEKEIQRLDAGDTPSNCYGIAAYADENLPRGWVRISDGSVSVYGEGQEILSALQDVEYDGSQDGWAEAWEALSGFLDSDPRTVDDWPAGLVKTEQLEEGTPNDNPNTLVTVKTNAGTRYAAGPHGANNDALWDTLRFASLHKSREDAVAAGCEFEEFSGFDFPE
jgi:hypothetical protein